MKGNILHKIMLFAVIIFTSCKEEEPKIRYEEYFKRDKTTYTDKLYSPIKTPIVPFSNNRIYDPFIDWKNSINNKSIYRPGNYESIRVIVLDTVNTTINISDKHYRKKERKGFPVIIENTSLTDTNTLILQKGCAKIIQEAKNKKGEWVAIEDFNKGKLGYFYYLIYPSQYIYTKVPLYKGSINTKLRVKLVFNDTAQVYSNIYNGTVKSWMLR